MKYYKVTRKELTTTYIFVQANTKAHASEIADNVDSESWRNENYQCNQLMPVIAKPDEMEGYYIETEESENSFIYKKP